MKMFLIFAAATYSLISIAAANEPPVIHVLRNATGVVQSQNYPANYDNNIAMRYVIHAGMDSSKVYAYVGHYKNC